MSNIGGVVCYLMSRIIIEMVWSRVVKILTKSMV